MRTIGSERFDFLGVYILPPSERAVNSTAAPETTHALVVMHLHLKVERQAQEHRVSASNPIATAILIVGKRNEVKSGVGAHELSLAACVPGPVSY